jgi:protein-disulfide isomerase
MKRLFVSGLIASTLCALGFAQPSDPVAVEIDGAKVTSREFDRKHPGRLFQARNALYQAERQAVEEFIDEYLLDRQARLEKVTMDELLKQHVESAIGKEPSEEALRVYYDALKTTEPFEKVRSQIVDVIHQVRLAKAKTAYVQSLRSQATILIRVPAPRAVIALKDVPARGVPDAPVTVVEYADYECPYCQQVQPALDKLESEYKGKLAFVFKDLPLPMHPNAQKAAEATRCAESQGKYWEYHDLLLQNKQLEIPKLKEHARALKLNPEAFDKCLDSGERSETVKAHFTEATDWGLNGTPSFFINGRFITGNLTYEQFRQVIEEELALTPVQHVARNQ